MAQPLPRLWVKAHERKRQEREALRLRVLEQVDQTLHSLVEKYQWRECYLFGSILYPGRFGPDSDVDIAVEGLGKHDLYRLVGELSMILEREVDVVILEESHLAGPIRTRGRLWSPKKQLPSS
ncbi:MAG: nucleotidyltransferase family protein [Thermodesulfobacteriota bacterium]